MKENPKYEEAFSIRHEVIGTARQCLYWGYMLLLQCKLQENQGCRKSDSVSTALAFSSPNMSQSMTRSKDPPAGISWMSILDLLHFLMHWPVLWKLMYQEHSDSSKGVLIQDCCYPRAIFLIFRTLLQNHPESSLIRQIPSLLLKQNIQVTLMFDKC